jgi:hypothetical protein
MKKIIIKENHFCEIQADLDAERTRKERSEKWRYRPVESFCPRTLKEAQRNEKIQREY